MSSEARRPPPGGADARTSWLIALGVGLAVAVIYALFSWLQWRNLFVPSWDLGIFSQLAKAYAGLDAPIAPIKGEGFNLLGDHFHPLLVLTGPLWALWPSGLSLLLLQAALFGISAVPLTRLAAERWGAAFGAALGLVYGLAWGLQSAVVVQFHEIAFAVPLLAFSLTAYLRGKWVAAACWAGALVFVKEDLGLTVAALGLVLALRPAHRGDPVARTTGIALAAWGVLWLVLATAVILPALNPLEQYDYTDRIGSPLDVLLPPIKWFTVALLACTAGIVGLRSPLILLMLPTLAWRFVGNVEHYWGWQWHYSAILMPIAVAALLDALGAGASGRLAAPSGTSSREDDAAEASPSLGAPASGTHTPPSGLRWGGLAVSAAATAATLAISANSMPLSHQMPVLALVDRAFYAPSERWDAAHEVIASIPEGSTVSADISLMAYLVPTAEVYWYGTPGNPAPDYFLMDYQGYHYLSTDQPGAEVLAEREWGVDYVPHAEAGGYVVVAREGGEPASPTMDP